MNRSTRASGLVLAGLAMLGTQPAAAAWPERPITIVVPYTPGGTVDVLARKLGPELNKTFGQPIVVDNKPGTGGSIGTASVARAQPDGYTLLLTTNSPLTTNPHLYKNVGYDPVADLEPVAVFGFSSMLFVANPKLGVGSLQELIALAKSKPGALSAGTSGNGATTHLALAELNRRAGISLVHVPYRGGVPSLTGAMAGEVQVSFSDITPAVPLVKDKKLVALASTSTQRAILAPDVPTMHEQGLAGFDVVAWVAMVAPRKTPADIVARLNAEVNRLLKDKKFQGDIATLGMNLKGGSVAEFVTFMQAEMPRWKAIVAGAGLKQE